MSDYLPSNYYQSLLNEFYWNLVEGRRLTQHTRRQNRADHEQENAESMQNTEHGATDHNKRKMPSPLLPIQINKEHQEEIINEIKAMNFNFWWSPHKIVRDVACQADSKYGPTLSPDVFTYVEMEVDRPQIPLDCRREVGTQVTWPFTHHDSHRNQSDAETQTHNDQPESSDAQHRVNKHAPVFNGLEKPRTQNESCLSGNIEISPRYHDSHRNQSDAETQTHNDQPESSNAQPRVSKHAPVFNGLKKPECSQEHNNPGTRQEAFRESSGASSQVNNNYSQEMYPPNQPYPYSRGYCHNFPLMMFHPLSSPGGFHGINSYMPPNNFPRYPLPLWIHQPLPICFYDPYSRRPWAYVVPGRPLMFVQNIYYSYPFFPPWPLQVNRHISARNNSNRYKSRPQMQPQCSTNKGTQTSKDTLPKQNGKKRDA